MYLIVVNPFHSTPLSRGYEYLHGYLQRLGGTQTPNLSCDHILQFRFSRHLPYEHDIIPMGR
jgi:hypothetical protein